MKKVKNLIKIMAIILAAAFCLQIASVVFAMENNPRAQRIDHIAANANYITISQDGSKIELWDPTSFVKPNLIKEIPFSGTVVNNKSFAINKTGTKVAIATNTGVHVFDTATGQCEEKFKLPQG